MVSRAVPTRVRVRDYIAESTAGTTRHKRVGTPAASDMMVQTVRPRLGNAAQRWPFCFLLFWVHRKTRRCLSQRLPPRKIMHSSTPHSSACLPLRTTRDPLLRPHRSTPLHGGLHDMRKHAATLKPTNYTGTPTNLAKMHPRPGEPPPQHFPICSANRCFHQRNTAKKHRHGRDQKMF